MAEVTERKRSASDLRGVVLCVVGVAVAVVALGLFVVGVRAAAYGVVGGGCLVLVAIISDHVSGVASWSQGSRHGRG